MYFDTLHRLGMDHEYAGQTDGRKASETDRIAFSKGTL